MLLYCSRTTNKKTKPELLSKASIALDRRPTRVDGDAKKHCLPKTNRETVQTTNDKDKDVPELKSLLGSQSQVKTSVKTCTTTKTSGDVDEYLSRNTSEIKTNPETASPGGEIRRGNRSRHVRFHSVELKEYAMTVGDHPFCKGYFPLTLDWCHAQPVEININDYEASKTSKMELHLDVRERFERLTLVSGMTESTLAYLEHCRRQRIL